MAGKLLPSIETMPLQPQIDVLQRVSTPVQCDHSGLGVRRVLEAPTAFKTALPFLFDYQQNSAFTLTKALERKGVRLAVDTSDTGLGKTWVALSVMMALGEKPFAIVCPANVVDKWERIATNDPFNLEPEFIVSYETIRNKNKANKDLIIRHDRKWKNKTITNYTWQAYEDCILIFDEAHRCMRKGTLNSQLLYAAVTHENIKVLALSATLCKSPLEMQVIGYGLGLHNYKDWWQWLAKMGCTKGFFGGMEFDTGSPDRSPTAKQMKARDSLELIHKHIYPLRGTGITKKEAFKNMPENRIMPEVIPTSYKSVKSYVKEIERLTLEDQKRADEKEQDVSSLVYNIRDHQETEIGKVEYMAEHARHLLDQGNSVILFVNYHLTIEALTKLIDDREYLILSGKTKKKDRDATIKCFQINRIPLLICQNQTASEAIDLDDIDGKHPRCVLISPSYSERNLLQILGRAHRITTKSVVMQWILFAQGTIEERMCDMVQSKLDNLSLLQEGSFMNTLRLK